MTVEPVIRFENVDKRFSFTPDTPQTFLEMLISSFSRRRGRRKKDLWALKDVSFDVERGQSLGIIGRNGSGKSTILKLIARILRPTAGRIRVDGRVGALLELGAGFHPDLTGRENIHLNASLLGLGKAEVEAAFDDIVAFSELGEYIDMPVKHYSSGMYMRLGFSVAIHVSPDILLVDEILAVGDEAFQSKCLDHIYSMKRSGLTIVMVSHNLNMIRHLCTHLLWVDHGLIMSAGAAEEVAAQYLAFSHGQEDLGGLASQKTRGFRRWGSREIEIVGVRFVNAEGVSMQSFGTGDAMTVEISYLAHESVVDPEFGLAIFRQDGIHVNGPNSKLGGMKTGELLGSGVVRYRIDALPLLPGRYLVTAAIHSGAFPIAYDFHEKAYAFRVTENMSKERFGLVELPASWEWQPAEDDRTPAANWDRAPSVQESA